MNNILLDEWVEYKLSKRKLTRNRKGYYTFSLGGSTFSLHRYVYEKMIGYIPSGYDVHHINENKDDNRSTNLELKEHREHALFHTAKQRKDKSNPTPRGTGTKYRLIKGLIERV